MITNAKQKAKQQKKDKNHEVEHDRQYALLQY